MVLALILFVILIALSLYIGYLGCSFLICLSTIPLLALVSIVVGTFLIIKLKTSFSFKIKVLIIIALFIVTPVSIAIFSMPSFQAKSNMQFDEKERIQENEVRLYSIKNPSTGKTQEYNDHFIYKNDLYKYSLKLPKDWGIVEQGDPQILNGNPYGDMYLSIFAPEYYVGHNYNYSFGIKSDYWTLNLEKYLYTGNLKHTISDVIINNRSAKLLQYTDPRNKSTNIIFTNGNYIYTISYTSTNLEETKKKLQVILDNLTFF